MSVAGPNHEASAYNAADEMALTRGVAAAWNSLAEPLAEHIFKPLAEQNHMAGLVALNATLTAPRLLKPLVGRSYDRHVENGQTWRAVGDVVIGAIGDASDGLDGAVARLSGLQSKFGVGFDPGVDAISLHDDTKRVTERARQEGDTTVLKLMGINSKIKLANIALGGVANELSARYVEKKGIVLEPHEQAHAAPLGKANFAGNAAATKALQLAYAFKPESTGRKVWRGIGIGLSGVSIATGVGATYQYTAAITHRLRKLKKD